MNEDIKEEKEESEEGKEGGVRRRNGKGSRKEWIEHREDCFKKGLKKR